MGLFDLFTKGDPAEKKREAALKKLTNMYYQKIDRMAAAESCAELARAGDSEAIAILLRRFEHLAPNTTSDREEKEYVVNLLVDLGAPAVAPIEAYVKRTAQPVYWPMLVLENLLDDDRFADLYADVLRATDNDYHRDPERKLGLVQGAGERTTDAVRDALLPFLDDHHEDVRHAAVDSLLRVTDKRVEAGDAGAEDTARTALVERLGGEEESIRIRSRILEAFARRGWSVEDRAELVRQHLVSGYRLDGLKVRKV